MFFVASSALLLKLIDFITAEIELLKQTQLRLERKNKATGFEPMRYFSSGSSIGNSTSSGRQDVEVRTARVNSGVISNNTNRTRSSPIRTTSIIRLWRKVSLMGSQGKWAKLLIPLSIESRIASWTLLNLILHSGSYKQLGQRMLQLSGILPMF